MLKLVNVGKIYNSNGNVAVGIRKVNLELKMGEFVAITGESGSGKSTLLNIISGIDTYEEGEMYLNGEETSYFSIEDLEDYHNKYVGFIFQNYNIIDSYTVLQNVETALLFLGQDKKTRRKKAKELIERVGLSDRMNYKASKLSGGEKQRVVIARALAKDPPIIAADEPTGNLDSKSSKEIIDLIHEVGKDKLVLIVTHDFNEVSDYATRIIRVYDSEIKEDRILKEAETSDLPTLESESVKAKPKDLFTLSVSDMVASPKRFIFHFLVFLVMAVFTFLSIGLYRIVISEIGYNYSVTFDNTDPSRIVLNKKDKSAFTESEINSLKSNKEIEYIFTDDIILDSVVYFAEENDGEYCMFDNYMNSMSNIKESDLVCGRLPQADDEIVISTTQKKIQSAFGSFDKILGLYVKYRKGFVYPTYKIVGVIDQDKVGTNEVSYAYLTDNALNSIYKDMYVIECLSLSLVLDGVTYESVGSSKYNQVLENFSGIRVSDLLKDNEIKFSYYDDTVSNVYIELYDAYGTIIKKDMDIISSSEQGNYIYLNQANYDLVMARINATYQLSVFSANNSVITALQKSLSKSGYNAVIPCQVVVSDFSISGLVGLLLLAGIAQFLVFTFFIVYAILVHSIKARKDDIEILRTIGATKSNVKWMFVEEFVMIGIMSFVITLVAYFILLFTTKGDFYTALKSLTTTDFIIYFIAVLMMSFLLSLLFAKSVFKKSIRKSLDQK